MHSNLTVERLMSMKIFALVLLFFCFSALASTTSAAGEQVLCSNEQETRRPCACCKIQCWHDVQRVSALLLGHAPGGNGDDQEALDTLMGIRKCANQNCAGLCALEKMLYPRRLAFRRRK